MKTHKKIRKSALSLFLCLVCIAAVGVAVYARTVSTGIYIKNTAVITDENGKEINITSATVKTVIVSEVEDTPGGGGSGGGGSTHRSDVTTEITTTETPTEAAADTDKEKEMNTEPDSEASSEIGAAGFDDTDNHWAKDFIEALRSENIVNGITDTLYYPDLSTKRGDFAVVLNRMLKLDEGKTVFTDVPSYSYYAQAIANCASAGIYIGYGDGTFKPENIITREEMMVIIAKLMNNGSSLDYKDTYSALESFLDRESVSWWSAPYVNYLAEQRIIVGDNNHIRPKDNVTRAEMAVIIYNYINSRP